MEEGAQPIFKSAADGSPQSLIQEDQNLKILFFIKIKCNRSTNMEKTYRKLGDFKTSFCRSTFKSQITVYLFQAGPHYVLVLRCYSSGLA